MIGFSDDELALLMGGETTEGLVDEDQVPELVDDPVTVLGDVWLLGNHRLMCGDSTSIDAVERLMAGKKGGLLLYLATVQRSDKVCSDAQQGAEVRRWWLVCRRVLGRQVERRIRPVQL